jgi:SAM-dependent methyltransferase
MEIRQLIDIWKQEEQHPFSGWNFSYLNKRIEIEPPPWSYFNRAVELMNNCSSMLDMGTGGGEWLLKSRQQWPGKVVATEGYFPNYKIAFELLTPLGVRVVNASLSNHNLMPFPDGEFRLIINRHSAFNCTEVARILKIDGTFLTEQVHGLFAHDLMSAFDSKIQYPESTLEYYLPGLKNAGLKVIASQDWSGSLKFKDVGAIVYYLKAIPWIVPGFSVDTHLDYLISLQNRVENGNGLLFTAKEYLIEAQKT